MFHSWTTGTERLFEQCWRTTELLRLCKKICTTTLVREVPYKQIAGQVEFLFSSQHILCSNTISGYKSLPETFPMATAVNHKQAFTAEHNGAITTTNTVEGMHGVLKNKARRLYLFSGQPSKGEAMRRKISELVCRINHRNIYADDFFSSFLNLLCVYYPCCSDVET